MSLCVVVLFFIYQHKLHWPTIADPRLGWLIGCFNCLNNSLCSCIFIGSPKYTFHVEQPECAPQFNAFAFCLELKSMLAWLVVCRSFLLKSDVNWKSEIIRANLHMWPLRFKSQQNQTNSWHKALFRNVPCFSLFLQPRFWLKRYLHVIITRGALTAVFHWDVTHSNRWRRITRL